MSRQRGNGSLTLWSYRVKMLLRKAAQFLVCLRSIWILYEGSDMSQIRYFADLKLLSENNKASRRLFSPQVFYWLH